MDRLTRTGEPANISSSASSVLSYLSLVISCCLLLSLVSFPSRVSPETRAAAYTSPAAPLLISSPEAVRHFVGLFQRFVG